MLSGIGDWRVYDFDHSPTFDAVEALLVALGLPADYRWVVQSGSRQGWHVWVRCSAPLPAGALPAKTRTAGVFVAPGRGFDHLELRWAHCYTVAPPSLHPSGQRYRFVHARPKAAPALVSVDRVVAAFHAVTHTPPRSIAAGLTVQRHGVPRRSGDAFATIKAEFDMLGFARQHWPGPMVDEGDEERVLGHGGLLLNPTRGIWHCFQETMGGDVLDLVGYARYGTAWDRHQSEMFRTALREAAAFAGVPVPVPPSSAVRRRPLVLGGRPPADVINTDTGVPQGHTGGVSSPPPTGGVHFTIVIGGCPRTEPINTDARVPQGDMAAPTVPLKSEGSHQDMVIGTRPRTESINTDTSVPSGGTARPTVPADSGGCHMFLHVGRPEQPPAPGAGSVTPPADTQTFAVPAPSSGSPRQRPRRAHRSALPSPRPGHGDGASEHF